MKVQTPREIAVEILKIHSEECVFIEFAVERTLMMTPLRGPDRGLVLELVYGVVRWQSTLDWLISKKTDHRQQNPTLQILLRLGLYQIFWLDRIPDHASVHETVEMAKRLGFGPQSGFINAVLRQYIRDKPTVRAALENLKTTEPTIGFSHPLWLVDRWTKRWGVDKTRELLAWNNQPPPTYARLNTLRGSSRQLEQAWENERVTFRARNFDWTPLGTVYELESHPPLAELPSFQQGLFYIQDPSTLLAPSLMEAERGQKILDLCAAPGGKTTYLAQLIHNEGTIIAQDTELRLKLVEENCTRLHVTCVAYETGLNDYDAILIDAPCSNTGVMRRRVDLRWRLNESELQRLATQQLALLEQCVPLLKTGGTLTYSTCSIEPEENTAVTEAFLERHPQFTRETEREIVPFAFGTDGAYAVRLRKG